MMKMTRRGALRALGAGAALLGFGAASGCGRGGSSMMAGGGMMGSATAGDMSAYMDLFARHDEIRRTVEDIPGGVRTITESDALELTRRLQTHVASMYEHLGRGAEVRCMSRTLPSLFRNADHYRRELQLTPKGVVVTETSRDRRIARAIRAHADEVSGFVREGMPAMMRGMMGAAG
jgi:hypothetical protein